MQQSSVTQVLLGGSTKGGGRVNDDEKFPYVSIRTGSSWRNMSKERPAGPSWSSVKNRHLPDEMEEEIGYGLAFWELRA